MKGKKPSVLFSSPFTVIIHFFLLRLFPSDNIKKKMKKKFEMTKNSIVSSKNTANGDSVVLSKPTIPTTMQGKCR